jgi:hypothetical protein
MNDNIWYVYRHLKPNGEVFYIGIGKVKNFKRAYNVKQRNSFWKSVFKKYGREVQLLKINLTLEEACEIEEILIKWYGRRDLGKGNLTNLNDGGLGSTNPSEKGREGISKSAKKRVGDKNPFFGKKHSQETREALSKINTGKKRTEDVKIKMSKNSSKTKSKKVIDTKTNTIFSSAVDASKAIGVPYGIFKKYLNGKSKNKTSCVYLENYANNVIVPNKDISFYKPPKKVIDTFTGVIYNTIKEASKINNIDYSSLKLYLSGKLTNKTTLLPYYVIEELKNVLEQPYEKK